MPLKITSLKKAYNQLGKSLDYYHSPMANDDGDLKQQFRNSVIQCFEYTYELTYKMIRRQMIAISEAPDSIKAMNFADLMRSAAEASLIPDVKRFLIYREMRNLTSHTYDEDKALQLVDKMSSFTQDVASIISELEKRNP